MMRSKRKGTFPQVLKELESDLLTGFFKPRERLVETALMERYHANRGTIRKALRELIFKHMIEHYPNRGVAVHELSLKEAEDLFATRLVLENSAADLVIRHMKAEILVQLESYESQFEEAIQSNDLRGMVNANTSFHRCMVQAGQNSVIAELIEQLRLRSYLWQHYVLGQSDRLVRTVDEHRAFLESLRRRDKKEFKELIKNHLASGFESYKDDLLRFHERTSASGEDGRT
jgi:DNA-binding GntR family transcriptional regulator